MDAVREYITQGGLFMFPIMIGTVWALTLLIERLVFFVQTGSGLSQQTAGFFALISEGKEDDAIRYLSTRKGVLSEVLTTAMSNRELPHHRIEEKMEAVLTARLPMYARYLNLLAALSGLMPIFGLLGTVTGMITTFKVISLHGTGDAQAMAAGIAEALITTQAGLVAAAPMILGHVLLTNRLKKITDKTREASARVLDYLKDHHA